MKKKKDNTGNTDEYSGLKKQIVRSWRKNRESAFSLYDKLLALREKTPDDKAPVQIDKDRVLHFAEQMDSNDFTDTELLNDKVSSAAIAYLKECVDKFQWQDSTKSVKYAQAIIHIGEMRDDKNQQALGLMALGDSIAIGGKNLEKAWKLQREAAELFLQDGDLIGWARTTIGRVGICIEMQCTEPTLKEAIIALGIFKRYNIQNSFVRLSLNIMRLLGENGQFRETLVYFQKAYPIAVNLKENGESDLGLLYINAGTSYLNLGEFNQAFEYFTRAREILTRLNKVGVLNHILSSIATIENTRGNYREALGLWNKILSGLEGSNTLYVIRFRMRMVECYLNLNRDEEARELARALISDLDKLGEKNGIHLAHGLRCLGTAEAKLGLWGEAQQTLARASDCYADIKSETWIRMTELLRGKIYAKQGDYRQALKIAGAAAAYFRKNRQPVNLGSACRLKAECYTGLHRYGKAMHSGQQLLRMGKTRQIAHFCYHGHLILGTAEAMQEHITKAGYHYTKAVETIEELQKNLTITIRPGFLEDKCAAGYALIRLLLQQQKETAAFEALERLKSMTMLGSLANRRQLFWSEETPGSQSLIAELNHLRKEYTALSRLDAEEGLLNDNTPYIDPQLLAGKLKIYEKRIRQCMEKLYLLNADRVPYIPVKQPTWEKIRQCIPENTFILEYFLDERELSIFIAAREKLAVCRLPVSIAETGKLLESYYHNINSALREGAGSQLTANLVRLSKNTGLKLYDTLVRPALAYVKPGARLNIVPFGLLHYIPFNTLYNGKGYFIEENEISILPSSGFLTRPCLPRAPGMLILAHTDNGKLPYVKQEAEAIAKIFDSITYMDADAVRQRLEHKPLQLLHIAAHGRHRMDEPDLSAIRLEDGYLYADDLLQQDLGYELVTLSACETGKTVVKKSEELIGLTRGLLFAGAQSVVVSLWRVDDAMTTQLMQDFYSCLHSGKSRAAALREAQLKLIGSKPGLHPAFWGAFQLLGFTGPLSGAD